MSFNPPASPIMELGIEGLWDCGRARASGSGFRERERERERETERARESERESASFSGVQESAAMPICKLSLSHQALALAGACSSRRRFLRTYVPGSFTVLRLKLGSSYAGPCCGLLSTTTWISSAAWLLMVLLPPLLGFFVLRADCSVLLENCVMNWRVAVDKLSPGATSRAFVDDQTLWTAYDGLHFLLASFLEGCIGASLMNTLSSWFIIKRSCAWTTQKSC